MSVQLLLASPGSVCEGADDKSAALAELPTPRSLHNSAAVLSRARRGGIVSPGRMVILQVR